MKIGSKEAGWSEKKILLYRQKDMKQERFIILFNGRPSNLL